MTQERFLMVEVDPPQNGDMSDMIKIAEDFKKLDVTSITFTDCPGGVPHADSILTAVKVKEETGMDVVPYVCCRDKNLIALRSQILGAHANGIRNMLFITGDQVPVDKQNAINSVFNCNSINLMELATDLNRFELVKNPIRFGGGVNYVDVPLDIEIKRVKAKMDNGALFFFSQPVYTEEDADKVRQIAKLTGANIYCGIRPLVNKRNADFLKEQVKRINVPDELVMAFSPDMSREEGEAIGLEHAKKMLAYINDFTYGYYFNFPYNRTYLLDELIPFLQR